MKLDDLTPKDTDKKATSPHKRRRVVVLVVGAALILGAAVCWFAWSRGYFTDKKADEVQNVSAARTPQEEVRQQTLNASAGPNATVQQQYILLLSKMNTEAVASNWSGVEKYANEIFQLEGHADDMSALTQLSTAQKNLGNMSEYKGTLRKIKSYLDKSGQTDSDYYRTIQEELAK